MSKHHNKKNTLFFMRWVSSLKKLCVRYVHSVYAEPILYTIAFVESFIFPVPPDVLLIPMSFITPKYSFRYALGCTVLSVLGGCIGYGIGIFFMDTAGMYIIELYSLQNVYVLAQGWFEKYGILTMLIAGITPVPYKLATIMAGMFMFSFPLFIITSLFGRGIRFFIFATLPHIVQTPFGKKIQKNIGIVFLLVVLFLIVLVSMAYYIRG